MKIYTKTGDKGSTSLLSGQRVKKNHQRLEAYGNVDELNSTLGLIIDYPQNSSPKVNEQLQLIRKVQHYLFNVGSHLACDDPAFKKHIPVLSETLTLELEKQIDEMNSSLPPLKNFILPGGTFRSSLCHNSRCVCRRAERLVCDIDDSDVKEFALPLLNRLSDYLFCLARFVNFENDVKDIDWDKTLV